jgi:hypothetical protein
VRQSVVWHGQSGMGYTLVAQPLESQVGESAGVYVFARRNVTGDGWVAICVGETGCCRTMTKRPVKRSCGT